MSRRKNFIDVPKSRTFLFKAYGLKSEVVNEYHLRIVHPELRAYFNWYHTQGTLIADINDGQDTKMIKLGKFPEDEDVATKICRFALSLIESDPRYHRTPRGKHSPAAVGKLVYG